MPDYPSAIHLGDQGGVLMCVELPNGRRVLQAGSVDVLDAQQAKHLRRELDRVLPWMERGSIEIGDRIPAVRDNRDEWEKGPKR